MSNDKSIIIKDVENKLKTRLVFNDFAHVDVAFLDVWCSFDEDDFTKSKVVTFKIKYDTILELSNLNFMSDFKLACLMEENDYIIIRNVNYLKVFSVYNNSKFSYEFNLNFKQYILFQNMLKFMLGRQYG